MPSDKKFTIAIFSYPFALKSAVYGLEDVFQMANTVCERQSIHVCFQVTIVTQDSLPNDQYDVLVLPPCTDQSYCLSPDQEDIDWINEAHNRRTLIASTCAGAFILAEAGLLENRVVTTHWGLEQSFRERYPHIELDINKIIINQGDIITAGGMMSWVDLGLEIISQLASPLVMRQLGKMLVVDTGEREQRFYKQFSPSFSHGDQAIVNVQHKIHHAYDKPMTVVGLADEFGITVRTLQRQFLKLTGFSPNQYLQRVRVQNACELLENSNHSFELIATMVGYEDISACRKVFVKIMGLTPGAFRQRFSAVLAMSDKT
ncbi:GlxA family transcriptional regulator [Vibrio sp. VB16]|uniref:GlxA family transcriptional regulator n=1 Tax=Vibrio sp. VB16 TaxID=2785746 RepID=UPI00189FD27A|nr:helix-turn-helix domain-containing protein [Vibrio sp. VB16]UGA53920.1 helix-turn-helix domain-containing protein [Vibrio sp. VB16]